MPHGSDEHTGGIGTQIAEQRRIAHLTQRGLAQRAHVSFSLLSKVEAGHRAASPALITACARALGIESSVLMGQPYIADQRAERFDAPLAAIRASLENWDVPLDPVTPPRALDDIAADVKRLGEERRRANYLKAATDAPALVDELVEASHEYEGAAKERAHWLLAFVYRCIHDVAYKLGHIDLGSTVLVRMAYSAERSGDKHLVILNSYLRAQSCFNTGRHDVGLRLMERALAQVEDDARRGDLGALCVQGNLRLRATMLAARQRPGDKGGADAARAQWQEAWETAERLGSDRQNYVMSFGPSNTLIHKVAMETELGNYGQAVKEAKKVHFPAEFTRLSPDRVGHHYIDLSRAQLWTGDHQAAFESLGKARAAAPQQARFHPLVRETVKLLKRADRENGESLASYARWVGM